MSELTPGDWEVKSNETIGGRTEHHVMCGGVSLCWLNPSELIASEANAKCMAASKQTLEALKDYVDSIEGDSNITPMEILGRMKEAITAAEPAGG